MSLPISLKIVATASGGAMLFAAIGDCFGYAILGGILGAVFGTSIALFDYIKTKKIIPDDRAACVICWKDDNLSVQNFTCKHARLYLCHSHVTTNLHCPVCGIKPS